MKPFRPFRGGLWVRISTVLALASSSLMAGTVVWDNSNGTFLWSTAANWDTNAEPTAADAAIFPYGGISTASLTLAAGELALSLQFDGNYLLSDGGLALASGNSIAVATGITATIGTPLDIAGGFTKTGPGMLVLGGANTYPGGLLLAEGTVKTGSILALGAGPVTFSNVGASNGTLDLGTLTGTLANDFTIGGSGTGSSTITYSGPAPSLLVLSGSIDLQRDLTVYVADAFFASAAVLDMTGLLDDGAGTFGLVKDGYGTLKLAAGNTFGGGTTLKEGILAISAESALGNGTLPLVMDGGGLQATASFVMARDVDFEVFGGEVRVFSPSVLELSGNVDWEGLNGFYGGGTTVISGTTTSTGASQVKVGIPANDTTDFQHVAFQNHVLSLRGSATLPPGNLLLANGGVLELGTGSFTRSLGTVAGTVQLRTSVGGGWAARGADLTVNLGGAGATLTWGQELPPFLYTPEGVAGVGRLFLGSTTATHTVDFANPLDLNDGDPATYSFGVVVRDGSAALDARISGGVINSTSNPATDSAQLFIDNKGTLEVSGPIGAAISIVNAGTGSTILSGTNSLDQTLETFGKLVIAGDASFGTPQFIYIHAEGEIGLGELDLSALTAPISVPATLVYGTLTGDVASSSILRGNGTVDGDLHALAGASVIPDYDFLAETEDQFHVTGDFTLDAAATIEFSINGVVPQDDYNWMRVTGAVDLAGDLVLDVGFLPAGYPNTLTLILNDGTDPIDGTFAGLAEGATISISGGRFLEVTYLANGDAGSVGNDFGVKLVPNPATSDLALGVDAPLAVDFGASITLNYSIGSSGGALVSDAVLDVTLPFNAALVNSTPAGTVDSGHLLISLPAFVTVPGATTAEVVLTAPAATEAVFVQASVGSATPDPLSSNNSAPAVTAVLAGGRPVFSDFVADPGAGNLTLTMDTLNGVKYALETSIDLEEWTEIYFFTGDGDPVGLEVPMTEPSEFYRLFIRPYSYSGGEP